ncbi:MAG: hypothetical protein P8Q92_00895 [Pseudoprimorskyibacter sp.]|nr:hypothetical protein [Pseudoprimorskyibacter sp.]
MGFYPTTWITRFAASVPNDQEWILVLPAIISRIARVVNREHLP